MRKHVALLMLIVAIIVAIALLRRPRPIENQAVVAPPVATSPIERPPPTDLKPEADAPEAPVLPVAPKKEPAPKPEPTPLPPPRECFLTVVDPDGVPVAEAVVLSVTHSYAQVSSNSKVKEARTDEKGELKINLGRNDSAHYLSYKVGVGSGVTGEIHPGKDATLAYEKNLTLTF